MKRRIKITIEYDGANYFGWQIQPDKISVEQKIEEALEMLFKQKIKIHGAGRTDAGVNALGQVAHFDIESNIDADRIKLAINTKLPKDIRIVESKEVDDEFHARYLAKGKIYRYTIDNGEIGSAIYRNSSYHVRHVLDINKMIVASDNFLGEHDFTSFCSAGTDVCDKVRTVYSVEIKKRDRFIDIEFTGNGFLYNMIRIMAGTLIDVAKHNIEPNDIRNIIEAKDRTKAGATAGACGLCLVKVLY